MDFRGFRLRMLGLIYIVLVSDQQWALMATPLIRVLFVEFVVFLLLIVVVFLAFSFISYLLTLIWIKTWL